MKDIFSKAFDWGEDLILKAGRKLYCKWVLLSLALSFILMYVVFVLQDLFPVFILAGTIISGILFLIFMLSALSIALRFLSNLISRKRENQSNSKRG